MHKISFEIKIPLLRQKYNRIITQQQNITTTEESK